MDFLKIQSQYVARHIEPIKKEIVTLLFLGWCCLESLGRFLEKDAKSIFTIVLYRIRKVIKFKESVKQNINEFICL